VTLEEGFDQFMVSVHKLQPNGLFSLTNWLVWEKHCYR